MCGILGGLATSCLDIDKGLAAMSSRGPDGHGVFKLPGIALAHARLAVIDLSSAAGQPMHSMCGRYTIVFNGEIYNYRTLREDIQHRYDFQTQSDTEVILAYFITFGARVVDYLRGMFAFAIWDQVAEELFVARDRLGVKPLYYRHIGNEFAFASRPKALCAMLSGFKPRIDKQALRYYLEAGYVPAPYSIFEEVRKLEPGHCLRVSKQGVAVSQYWSANRIDTDPALAEISEVALLDELDSLLMSPCA